MIHCIPPVGRFKSCITHCTSWGGGSREPGSGKGASPEPYAAANCVNDVIALSYVCKEAGIREALPFTIHIDNQAAISYMTRRDFAGRTKLRHIDARACCQWVEALRDAQLVAPRYTHTES